MYIVCCDLEGVFVPEVWLNIARETGIEELSLTTRDIKDYGELMRYRIKILKEKKITLSDIQKIIEKMKPLSGAKRFLDWLRKKTHVVIVSGTFEEFAKPLMKQLGWPALFCNSLKINKRNMIVDFVFRQEDGKKKIVEAFHNLNYKVIAMGDSYNDLEMLKEADKGILFRPPEAIIKECPQFPVVNEYEMLKKVFGELL